MADNKKYYYIKLQENFFDREEILMLESIENGYLYSNILLKLYLKSLKNEGKLMFNNLIPYTPEILSKALRHNIDTVRMAIKVLKDFGLVEVLDNGAIYMNDIQNFIGESSTEADRKRAWRAKIENEKRRVLGQSEDKCPIKIEDKCPDKNPPEYRDKSIEYRDIDINNIEQQVAQVWSRYPVKKGKAVAVKKLPKLIKQYGYEQLIRCIERYEQTKSFKDGYKKQGDTFFNGAYVDYLDENYQEEVENSDESRGSGKEIIRSEAELIQLRRARELGGARTEDEELGF